MSSSKKTELQEFGKIRSALWPIHGYEMKKFLPMGFIMFLILFNYTILRDVKDVLIVTAPGAGSPVLGFLKGWLVMPAAILFVMMYTKMTNVFSQEKIFYYIVTGFIVFFGLFGFLFFPNQDLIHPSQELIKSLQVSYPNLQFIFPIWGVWSYSLFYIMAEIWGASMIALLFWQFANKIVKTNEAKRFYSLFMLISNVALIVSGETIKYFSASHGEGADAMEAWGVSLRYMMCAVVICGLLAIYIYRWMHVHVLTDKRYYDPKEKAPTKKKSKMKMGMMEGFKYMFTNPYIACIAMLVLAYGISINLIEVVWKDQIRVAFPSPKDYARFMGQFSQNTGIITIILVMFTKSLVRKMGWFVGAIVTPLIMIITGGLFFALVLCKNTIDPMMTSVATMIGVATMSLPAWIGSIQNALTKGTKYAQFDPTKEMAYIPLDDELKTKGKAAVDVVGNRLGKALGGYTQNIVFIATGTKDVLTVAPIFGGVIALVVLGWIVAVFGLSKRYNALVKEKK